MSGRTPMMRAQSASRPLKLSSRSPIIRKLQFVRFFIVTGRPTAVVLRGSQEAGNAQRDVSPLPANRVHPQPQLRVPRRQARYVLQVRRNDACVHSAGSDEFAPPAPLPGDVEHGSEGRSLSLLSQTPTPLSTTKPTETPRPDIVSNAANGKHQPGGTGRRAWWTLFPAAAESLPARRGRCTTWTACAPCSAASTSFPA